LNQKKTFKYNHFDALPMVFTNVLGNSEPNQINNEPQYSHYSTFLWIPS